MRKKIPPAAGKGGDALCYKAQGALARPKQAGHGLYYKLQIFINIK
jgi:hypothetical protein